jgi:HK97 family phage portal protein
VILATKGGDAVLRDASVGAVLAAEGLARGGQTGGTAVTGRNVNGLPAYNRAIAIASQAVAKRRQIRVFRGEDSDRRRVTTTWQARFFAGQPNERDSWFSIFEQTEASLTARNNAIWLKLADALGRVISAYVIHPDNVQPRWNKLAGRIEYRIRLDASADWSDWLTSSEILHFKVGYLEPGAIWAPSPIQIFRDTLGAALAKVRFEKNLYDKGVMQQIAAVFPAGITKEQAEKFKDVFQGAAGGVDNSSGVRVFGGGVDIHTIGLSMVDAQFVEAMNLDVEQVARITGVTASLLGGATGAGVRTAPTPEQEEDRWHRYGLETRLGRIEETIKADPSFFGVGARDYPEFAPAPIRADAKTESDILVHEVQGGVITQNEARAAKGMPPSSDPRADELQFTPVGGAVNDNTSPSSGGNQGGDA